MVENYNNLDFRINLLYNAVYNKNTQDDYEVEPIVLSNIRLIDIKLSKYANLSSVFDGKFTYLGKHNGYWEFKRQSENSHSTLFMAKPYSGNNINDMGSPELYNAAMHYILSELALTRNLRHVMLPIMCFDTTIDKIREIGLPESEESTDKEINVLVLEKFFKFMPLEEYLLSGFETSNIDYWRVLIFQVVYTLYEITERLGNFRHNNLGINSIGVYRKSGSGYDKYDVGNTSYYVPKLGFEIKICDFDKAYTSNYTPNKNAPYTTENPYYDIHYFLNSVYLFLKNKKISIPSGLMDFIKEVIPEQFLVTEDFNGLDEEEYFKVGGTITPKFLLKNSFFDSFITNKMRLELSVSPMNINETSVEPKYGGFVPKKTVRSRGSTHSPSITEDDDTDMRMLARTKIDNNKKINSEPKYSNMSSDSSSVFSEAENIQKRNRRSNRHKMTESSYDSSEFAGGRSSRYSDSSTSDISDVLRTTYTNTMTDDSEDYSQYGGKKHRSKKYVSQSSDSEDVRDRNTINSEVLGSGVSQMLKKLPPNHIQEVPLSIMNRINAYQTSRAQQQRPVPPMSHMMPPMGMASAGMYPMGMQYPMMGMPGMYPQMGGGCMTGGTNKPRSYVFMKDGQPVTYAPEDFFFQHVITNRVAQS